MHSSLLTDVRVQMILRACASLMFLGLMWQHLFWETPYWSWLTSESIFGPLIDTFSLSWTMWASAPDLYRFTEIYKWLAGACFGICAVELMVRRGSFFLLPWAVALHAIYLILSAMLHGYPTVFLAENSLRFLVPLVILGKTGFRGIAGALVLTFAGHGLFAAGVLPVPGHFIDMVVQILGIKEHQAVDFLWLAGMLDFAIALAVLTGFGKRPWLAWACFWGLATALARPIAGWDAASPLLGLHQWFHEFLLRTPHVVLPFLLWLKTEKPSPEGSIRCSDETPWTPVLPKS